MDLSTTYLGLKLKNPLVPSASPLSESVANIKKMEDNGASAVVMHSLFEEQIRGEGQELNHNLTANTDSFSEAQSFFPELSEYRVGADEYLNHIRKAKESVKIPVIASLNGISSGGWIEYAKGVQQAGADAIELNMYSIPTDPDMAAQEIEAQEIEVLKKVRSAVKLPIAVKLSPYFTSLPNVVKRMNAAGADAFVLFNRFYQPDIELEELNVASDFLLSTSRSMRLPLRWISLMFGKVPADFAATGGIHRPEDVIKMIMAGANITMLCSVLLSRGIETLKSLEKGMSDWMVKHQYQSLDEMRGSMSQMKCSDPSAFERAQYIRSLHSFKPSF